jgi:hypothetical protein
MGFGGINIAESTLLGVRLTRSYNYLENTLEELFHSYLRQSEG